MTHFSLFFCNRSDAVCGTDAGQFRGRTGQLKDRTDTGQGRSNAVQNRTDAGQLQEKTVSRHDATVAGKDGCRTGQMQDSSYNPLQNSLVKVYYNLVQICVANYN